MTVGKSEGTGESSSRFVRRVTDDMQRECLTRVRVLVCVVSFAWSPLSLSKRRDGGKKRVRFSSRGKKPRIMFVRPHLRQRANTGDDAASL